MRKPLRCLRVGLRGHRLIRLISVLFLWSTLRLHADTWGPFTYRRDGNAITITKYYGADGSVTVPETIDGLPVTAIDTHAFGYGSGVTHLSLPTTLISLGNPFNAVRDSLDWLESLEAITVAEGNPQFSSRDGLLFSRDQTSLFRCPKAWAGDYSVPDTVRRIGVGAFSWCRNLERLTLLQGVTEVGERAFEGCLGLIRVITSADLVPAVVAACSCSGRIDPASHLRFLIVNEHVAVTGHDYYEPGDGTSKLPIEVEIPPRFDGRPVTFIGSSACQWMALSKVTIPATVIWIGEGAFSYCRSLNRMDVAAGNPYYRSVEGVLFDASLDTLLQYPGARVGDFAVPAGVIAIGASAFDGCEGLSAIQLPAGLVHIGPWAFRGCQQLLHVTIPDHVETIGAGAFYQAGLQTVQVGRGVAQIGDSAFDNRRGACRGGLCYGPDSTVGARIDLFFTGAVPLAIQPFGDRTVFWGRDDFSEPPRVFHLAGAAGWGTRFGGVAVTPWRGEPMFRNAPLSAARYAGYRLEFSAKAVGPEPIIYQWLQGDQEVPGATNAVLSLSPLKAGDAGSWRLRVSNAYGSAMSEVATVTVHVPAPGSYEAAALSLGPLAYWPLDEAEGSTVVDLVNGDLGDIFGSALLQEPGATPNTGSSVAFNGESSIYARHNPAWDVGTGDFTVAAWINPSAFVHSGIATKGGYDWAQGWLFDFSSVGEGTLRLETSLGIGGGQGTVQSAPGVVTLNEWQHVVVSCRRDPAAGPGLNTTGKGWTKIYRNGVQVAAGDIGTGNLNNPNLPFALGTISNWDAAFPGRMDEVALFGRALSPEQVADLYAAGFGTPPPLRITRSGDRLTLTWTGSVLQSATTLGDDGQPAGWSDLTAATSPWALSLTNAANFFRMRTP